jgi:hypothetical protein
MSIDPGTGVLTWTPADGPVTESVTVRVTDDGAPALSSTVTFDVTVTNVAPTLTLSGATSAVPGQTYVLALTVVDPGTDTINGWLIDWGDGTTPEPVAGSASNVTHVYAVAGDYVIEASATDEDGTYSSNQLSVTANSTPVLVNPGNKESTLGRAVSLQLIATDPDAGSSRSFSASGLPLGLSINSATGLISGTPTKTGNYNVTASVSDLRGGTATVAFTWFITRKSTTPVPTVDLTASAPSVAVGARVTLSWTSTNATSCVAYDGWSGSKALNGSEVSEALSIATSFTLTCTGIGGSATDFVVVDVGSVVNNAPQLANPGPQSSSIGQTISLALSATDADGDLLTYLAAGLPPNLSINPATGIISGTLFAAGIWTVTVEAMDGRGGVDQETFTWTVAAAANSPPTVVNPGDQSSRLNDSVSLQIQATDIDGDSMTYAATGLPVGLAINSSTGTITGTTGSPGKTTAIVTVTDSKGASTSVTFRWSVSRK